MKRQWKDIWQMSQWLETAINIKCKCIQQKETNNNKNIIVRISKANKKQQKQRDTREKKIINQNKD